MGVLYFVNTKGPKERQSGALKSIGKLRMQRRHLPHLHDRYAADALNVDVTDGHSFEFEHWRFNIRMSNTEPVVRLNVEARADSNLIRTKTQEVLSLFENA